MAAIALQAARRPPKSRTAGAPGAAPEVTLKPLDPEIVSASIPAFFIGRNKAGLWVAREARGRIGGLFLFKSSAVDFASRQIKPVRCALVFPTETFELDIENRGTPLIVPTARLLDGLKRRLLRLVAR